MFILLIVLAFALIAYWEGTPLYRERRWGELAVMGVVWSLALALSLAQVLNLTLPNPTDWMERVFVPVSRFLDRLWGVGKS